MNLHTQNSDLISRHPRDGENAIIGVYDKSLFPRARFVWIFCKGRTRPIKRKFNDNRLVIAYSTLRPDASGEDGYYLRRVFYLLPKDLISIRKTWPKAGQQLSESEKALESIFNRHEAGYPKSVKLALMRHKVE